MNSIKLIWRYSITFQQISVILTKTMLTVKFIYVFVITFMYFKKMKLKRELEKLIRL